MAKKLKSPPFTLEQTWRYQLQMSEWIAEKIKNGSAEGVITLKGQWLEENGFDAIQNDCFFCQYDEQFGDDCRHCPAKLIDEDFHCSARNIDINYAYNPVKFYAKLIKLNKKRLAAKRNKKRKK